MQGGFDTPATAAARNNARLRLPALPNVVSRRAVSNLGREKPVELGVTGARTGEEVQNLSLAKLQGNLPQILRQYEEVTEMKVAAKQSIRVGGQKLSMKETGTRFPEQPHLFTQTT